MKTPREFFFDKHRSAETKLDAIRKNVIATAIASEARSPARPLPILAVLKLWQELILPYRRTWAGLAAVWVVVFAVQIAPTGSSPQSMASDTPAPGPGILAALREQRQMLVQLLDPLQPGPAVRPRTPRPRGTLEIIRFV